MTYAEDADEEEQALREAEALAKANAIANHQISCLAEPILQQEVS